VLRASRLIFVRHSLDDWKHSTAKFKQDTASGTRAYTSELFRMDYITPSAGVRIIIHLMPELDKTRAQPFDLRRTGWAIFFEVPFILHVSVMDYTYILSFFNLVVILYILYYYFNTTKLVYKSNMVHEGIRTVKRGEKGRDR
jgi:hypothetical protein